MRFKQITIPLSVTFVLAYLLPSFSVAERTEQAPIIVVSNCSGCHGLNGIAQISYFPNLASQDQQYLQHRLTDMKEAPPPPVDEFVYRIIKPHSTSKRAAGTNLRINMLGIAHSIPLDQLATAAAWYSSQQAPSSRSSRSTDLAAGQRLFENGSADQRTPACRTCHGSQAEGKRAIAPRLAGQNSQYIRTRLAEFRSDSTSKQSVMNDIAKHLTPEQTRSLSAYLQSK